MLQHLHQRVHTSQSELSCMCLTLLYSLITSVGFSNPSHAKIQQFENNVLSLTFQIWTPARIYLIVWLLESHSISVGFRFPHLSNGWSYLTLSWIPWSILTLIAYLMSIAEELFVTNRHSCTNLLLRLSYFLFVFWSICRLRTNRTKV